MDIDQAKHTLDNLARRDLKLKNVTSNAGGLEVLEGGEWSEYYNDDGQDIDEIMRDESIAKEEMK